MSVDIQTARREHRAWLVGHDHHASPKWVSRCIDRDEYLVASLAGGSVGFLRYSWFWRAIPYMELIWVDDHLRRQGVGTALFETWQTAMAAQGAKVLMTSSVERETEPQAWHRRNGFTPSGRLTFGRFEPDGEIFFVKDI